MNYIKSLFLVIVLLGLSGCFMERPTIPRGYNVVYSQVDWLYFDHFVSYCYFIFKVFH